MAGFRQFVTGEVLTASNVDDFLAKQAVMKFASAAARDSALGTATGGANALREGMVAYLDDTDALVKYDGTAWAAIGNAGIGSNVVQAVKTDAFSTASASLVAVTGLSASITPSAATSKIFVVVAVSTGHSAVDNLVAVQLKRGAVSIAVPASGANAFTVMPAHPLAVGIVTSPIIFLDSPASVSAQTYSIEIKVFSGTGYVNRSGGSADNTAVSTITLIEVAA